MAKEATCIMAKENNHPLMADFGEHSATVYILSAVIGHCQKNMLYMEKNTNGTNNHALI